MGLSIDSAKVQQLAEQLARETGEPLNTVIEKALEDRLSRLHRYQEREARFRRIKEIVARAGPVPPGVTSDHSDFYDEDGLPA